MREADLGIGKDGKHDSNLTTIEAACLDTLQELGQGAKAAISAKGLASFIGLTKEGQEDEQGMRSLRELVNHLVITHRLPILSAAGGGGGYFLAGTEAEVEKFYRTFHRRAMTGLLKASRGKKAAFVDIMHQLTLGFDEPEAKEALEKLRLVPDSDPVPAWIQLVTKALDRLTLEPQKYADQIREIQVKYGDIFIPRDTVRELKKKTADLQELLGKIA